MTSFSALKSNAATLSEKLKNKFKEEIDGNKGVVDERFWKPARDKAGNGYALIRFLPPAPNADVPGGIEDCFYVRVFKHAFQGKGGWYIENSLTTIGETDPCGEYNSLLWNSGIDADKEQARKQKRKTEFISNILVIDDPATPSNNGKVFLYRYGKKIFEKINDKMNPTFPGEKKINPFDFWEGADFMLKIREVEKYPNYDRAEFGPQSALFGGDEARLEAVWRQQHPLLPLIDKNNFKSYDELTKRLNKALGLGPVRGRQSEESFVHPEEYDDVVDTAVSTPRASKQDLVEESSDELEFFRRMAAKK